MMMFFWCFGVFFPENSDRPCFLVFFFQWKLVFQLLIWRLGEFGEVGGGLTTHKTEIRSFGDISDPCVSKPDLQCHVSEVVVF